MNPTRPAAVVSEPAGGYDSILTRSSLLGRLHNLNDDASWRTFFDTYWQLIYNVARKSGLSVEDAQDVVQETVLAVARKIPQFSYDPAKGSFKQWLLLITRRRIHDRLRQLYRAARITGPAAEECADTRAKVLNPVPAPDAAIDAAWEEEWRQTLFEAALTRVRERVNPKQFQVFDYCVLQNLRPSLVANMLAMNAAQVYLAKHRVSAQVKRAVAEIEAELGHTQDD